MRLWHYKMLNALPKLQLVSQWRECILIAKSIKENGTPNHLLVNNITKYSLDDFRIYCNKVLVTMVLKKYNVTSQSINKLEDYIDFNVDSELSKKDCFIGWHNIEYLRICYANLYEKHLGVGKSKITDNEWQVLLNNYKKITNEDWVL